MVDWKLMAPAVVPFMFSLTWGLDSSEVVGASPREGCGSGLGPPQPSSLWWRQEALSPLSRQPQRLCWWALSASARPGWVKLGRMGQIGTEKEELPGFCEVNMCLKQFRM